MGATDSQSGGKGEVTERAEHRFSGSVGFPHWVRPCPGVGGLDSLQGAVVCVVQGLDCLLGIQGDL